MFLVEGGKATSLVWRSEDGDEWEMSRRAEAAAGS
jgi:hypothetical protein